MQEEEAGAEQDADLDVNANPQCPWNEGFGCRWNVGCRCRMQIENPGYRWI